MAKSTNTSSGVWAVDLPEPAHSFELTGQVEVVSPLSTALRHFICQA
jgi:hypothetical protein